MRCHNVYLTAHAYRDDGCGVTTSTLPAHANGDGCGVFMHAGVLRGMAPHNAGPPGHHLRQVGQDLGPGTIGRETDGDNHGHGADPATHHRAGVPGGGELTVEVTVMRGLPTTACFGGDRQK